MWKLFQKVGYLIILLVREGNPKMHYDKKLFQNVKRNVLSLFHSIPRSYNKKIVWGLLGCCLRSLQSRQQGISLSFGTELRYLRHVAYRQS